jgi:hypothetical protein
MIVHVVEHSGYELTLHFHVCGELAAKPFYRTTKNTALVEVCFR